jgi:PAS domain S-box-containing protein
MESLRIEKFADLLLETMADGVFTVNRSGAISSWNPAMERITGYKPAEVIGEPCSIIGFDLCIGRSCPSGVHDCGIFSRERIDGQECFIRHKNGTSLPVVKSARILKGDDNAILGVVETITDMTELHKARQAAEEANRKLGNIYSYEEIIGKSSGMQQVFSSIKASAESDVTILIQGDSGTGKELVARAVHYNSLRAKGPFVTVNCRALSESLLESELFGHVKGSFTGAFSDRVGRFEEAEGGTLFLDEIGEISPFIQVKLLRVLQEREIERVGDSKKRKIDIRVITATNKDLYKLVHIGEFREDLYYRLKVFPIFIPPLQKRKDDLQVLVSHFIKVQNRNTGKKITGVTAPAMRIIMDYNWPGNVRELENAIEHAFVLCAEGEIDIFDLPVEIRKMEYRLPVDMVQYKEPKPKREAKKMTKAYLIQVLEASDWNKAEVARRVGLSRASIWKYMKKWDIPMSPENV